MAAHAPLLWLAVPAHAATGTRPPGRLHEESRRRWAAPAPSGPAGPTREYCPPSSARPLDDASIASTVLLEPLPSDSPLSRLNREAAAGPRRGGAGARRPPVRVPPLSASGRAFRRDRGPAHEGPGASSATRVRVPATRSSPGPRVGRYASRGLDRQAGTVKLRPPSASSWTSRHREGLRQWTACVELLAASRHRLRPRQPGRPASVYGASAPRRAGPPGRSGSRNPTDPQRPP